MISDIEPLNDPRRRKLLKATGAGALLALSGATIIKTDLGKDNRPGEQQTYSLSFPAKENITSTTIYDNEKELFFDAADTLTEGGRANTAATCDRFGRKMGVVATRGLNKSAKSVAGMCVDFTSTSDTVEVRWTLNFDYINARTNSLFSNKKLSLDRQQSELHTTTDDTDNVGGVTVPLNHLTEEGSSNWAIEWCIVDLEETTSNDVRYAQLPTTFSLPNSTTTQGTGAGPSYTTQYFWYTEDSYHDAGNAVRLPNWNENKQYRLIFVVGTTVDAPRLGNAFGMVSHEDISDKNNSVLEPGIQAESLTLRAVDGDDTPPGGCSRSASGSAYPVDPCNQN